MTEKLQINADRFKGFASIYDRYRPTSPTEARDILLNYLERSPELVVDLGCGTGLSTWLWQEVSDKVIGIEPSEDMLEVAREKTASSSSIEFIKAFAHDTGLPDHCADVITCSQSFHWMDPDKTLKEVNRLLKKGGVFAVYDCDWPPVAKWEIELAYNELLNQAKVIESSFDELKEAYKSWPKDKHFTNINGSGYFRYVRECVFTKDELCDAERFVGIALSQGGIQSIIRTHKAYIEPDLNSFEKFVKDILDDQTITISFGYRMVIGVK